MTGEVTSLIGTAEVADHDWLAIERKVGCACSVPVDSMAERGRQVATAGPIRIGVGHAVRPELAAELVPRLQTCPGIADIVTYEVGPSVGAHTGPGTLDIVYDPVSR